MTKSIKKLCWAGMASAVMMTVGSCEKFGSKPEEKPEETKPKTETKAYQELWVSPAYAGAEDVYTIDIIWDRSERNEVVETTLRRRSTGNAKFSYENSEPLLSEDDPVLWTGRDGTAFPADAGDIFKIMMSDGTVVTGVPKENAIIRAYHYSGENANPRIVKDFANKQIKTAPQFEFERLGY